MNCSILKTKCRFPLRTPQLITVPIQSPIHLYGPLFHVTTPHRFQTVIWQYRHCTKSMVAFPRYDRKLMGTGKTWENRKTVRVEKRTNLIIKLVFLSFVVSNFNGFHGRSRDGKLVEYKVANLKFNVNSKDLNRNSRVKVCSANNIKLLAEARPRKLYRDC